MESVTISVSGMTCGHCVSAVQKALATVPGLTVDEVAIGSARVTLDPALTSLAVAEAAIEAAGYDVVKGRLLNIMADTKAVSKSDA